MAHAGIVVAADVIGVDAMTGQAGLDVSDQFGERRRKSLFFEVGRFDCTSDLMTHFDHNPNVQVKHRVFN